MSDEVKQIEVATTHEDHGFRHPYALLLAGTAIGVGLGLLIAPHKGSETRKQVADGFTRVKSSCASGLHKAKDVAGDWAHKGGDAYNSTKGYVREVSEAVTRKAHRQADAIAKPELPIATPREQPPARPTVAVHSGSSVHRSAGAPEAMKQGA